MLKTLILALILACGANLYATPVTMLASYYGSELVGARMANGMVFNPRMLIAAHKTLPLGTVLKITNPRNKRSIVLAVLDRGPYSGQRELDLSHEAAKRLGFIRQGTAYLRVEILRNVIPKGQRPQQKAKYSEHAVRTNGATKGPY